MVFLIGFYSVPVVFVGDYLLPWPLGLFKGFRLCLLSFNFLEDISCFFFCSASRGGGGVSMIWGLGLVLMICGLFSCRVVSHFSGISCRD